MSTTVDILCFLLAPVKPPDNQLFTVKYDFYLEIPIYIGTYISLIT